MSIEAGFTDTPWYVPAATAILYSSGGLLSWWIFIDHKGGAITATAIMATGGIVAATMSPPLRHWIEDGRLHEERWFVRQRSFNLSEVDQIFTQRFVRGAAWLVICRHKACMRILIETGSVAFRQTLGQYVVDNLQSINIDSETRKDLFLSQ